ncbi:MAG TPA: DUF167 domain-containing protein [Devosia sp.]|nr:DUF167 domain-containing protein [Devosia sp.]
MAKRRADVPPADAIRALADAEGRLVVRVTPGARVEGLEIADDRLLAKVRAKPEDGKANAAVLALIADALGVGASRLTLLRGATSREKLVRISP